jgi:hypothetical protein
VVLVLSGRLRRVLRTLSLYDDDRYLVILMKLASEGYLEKVLAGN